MRDNHEGLPEIINAYVRDEHYFCSIGVTIGTETKILEFGVNQESYLAVNNILHMRPFEQFPGVKYRYFYAQGKSIRIEQGKQGKQFEVNAPKALFENLTYFYKGRKFNELDQLREVKP